MTGIDVIRAAWNFSRTTTDMLLGDLSDEDLLKRPVPGANHIAWQLGHVITAENYFGNAVAPGQMPPLPEGFAEKHSKESASKDDPASFCTKEEYMRVWKEQRNGSLAILGSMTDEDLDKPSPQKFQAMWPTMGHLLLMFGMHDMMHSGQYSVVRRTLGKSHAF